MTTAANIRKSGIEPRAWSAVSIVDFGAIDAADSDRFIKAATSTELPNNETVTYTFPSASVSPQDSDGRLGDIDTPRNVVATVTHSSSIVAMTVLVSGLDMYGNSMSELLSISATGTSKTASGKKAFASISSIAINSGGNAESNTLNVGTGTIIGLPYVLSNKNHALPFVSGVVPSGSADASATATLTSDTTAPSDGDTVTIDNVVYTFRSSIPAVATITTDTTEPADGSTVTIGETVYTFKTALTTDPATVPYEVLIGISAAVSLDNLKAAINGDAGEGTTYGTGTEAHPDVTATTNGDTTQVIEGNAGVDGDDIELDASTDPNSHMSWGDTTMTGADVPYAVLIGTAAESLDYLKAAINLDAGEGTAYGTGTVAHPTVEATTNNDTTQVVSALVAGRESNEIEVSETSSHLSWGTTTLTGGEQTGLVIAAGVTSTATTTTGDVRGTVDFDESLIYTDEENKFTVWMVTPDDVSEESTYGVAQA